MKAQRFDVPSSKRPTEITVTPPFETAGRMMIEIITDLAAQLGFFRPSPTQAPNDPTPTSYDEERMIEDVGCLT